MMNRTTSLDLALDMEQSQALYDAYREQNPDVPEVLVILSSGDNYRVIGFDAYLVAGILRIEPQMCLCTANNIARLVPVLDINNVLAYSMLQQLEQELMRPIIIPWNDQFDIDPDGTMTQPDEIEVYAEGFHA